MENRSINILGTKYQIEILHAFMAESGLQSNRQHIEEFGHDETTVDWFAIQSPKIFKVFQELDIL